MHRFSRMGMVAALAACLIGPAVCARAQAPAQPKKNYKDQGEYDIYAAVSKDVAGRDFAKAVTDLGTWKQKYPTTDFADERNAFAVQSYAGAKQPAQAVDSAKDLVGKNLVTLLGAAGAINILYTTASSIQQVPEPTPEQLATAEEAAKTLAAFDSKPDGVTAEAWPQARTQVQTFGKTTQIYLALVPGTQAMKQKDCAAAETSLLKAIQTYPDSGQAAWLLGTAELCLYKTQPERASQALYAFARAAAMDPAKAMVDPKWQKETVEPYLERIYNQYHGQDAEGLKQLKETAVQTPLQPQGFAVKSVTQVAQEKEAEFARTNPQLALWMKIKGALADTGGEQYFASSMKDAAVSQLRGVVVEGKPACRPNVLLVAVPLPGTAQPYQPEITLKLDKALTGKVEPNTEFRWEGVPTAFSQNPFMLTMDTETAKVEGLKPAPCAAARPPVRRRPAARKK